MKISKTKVKFVFCLLFCFCRVPFGYAQQNYPQRIISLGPALTEELYLLGADDKLVGCTLYCSRPTEAKNKTKVGTVIDINLEKAVSLRPDLVLATSLTNPEAKEKLKNLGVKVVTFPAAESFSEICGQFLELGRLVGKEKEAAKIIGSAKNKVDFVREKVNGLPKPKVFIQVGANPLVTAGKGSFVSDFIELAGGINTARGTKTMPYSREEVIRDNPEVIIIVTMGIQAEKEKETWGRFKTLKAVVDNRIYIVDSDLLCSPTPISFAEILQEIVKILHPQNE